ncbi:MAG: diguanylate cyclase, partial [Chloroflexota bacterium]|nr:diguanylate cyclase [Chloroflexota bacterium]
ALTIVVEAVAALDGITHAALIQTSGRQKRPAAGASFVPSAGLAKHVEGLDAVFGEQMRAMETEPGRAIGPDFVPGLGPCHLLSVPVAVDPEHAFNLVLIRTGRTGFGEGGLATARLIADQAGLALRMARIDEERRTQLDERATVARITQTVVTMQDLDAVLDEVAMAVRKLSGWEACSVGVLARDIDAVLVRSSIRNTGDLSGIPQPGERLRLRDWQSLRFALDNCAPYQVGPDQAETLTEAERSHFHDHGIASWLAIPFVVNGEAIGAVILYSREARCLSGQVLRTVQEIGTNAALAIQHSQYAVEAQQQAEEQSALLRVSHAVISGKDLRVILSEVARVSLGFEGVEACRILLWHKEEDQFEIGAMQSVRDWQMLYQVSDRYPATDWPSCRAVAQTGQPLGLHISDPELTARERANHIADGILSFHSFAIQVGESSVGVLSLLSRSRRRLPKHAVRMGQELALQAAHAIDRTNLFRQLQRRAETDGLTGLLNHRAAFEALDRELAAARKLSEPISIIVVDLDDFKFFNDTHGHLTGDRVLVEVAKALQESCRPRDYVARYGGDEFLLILPGTNEEVAAGVGVRLLRRMESTTVTVHNLELPVRISVGVATFPNDASNRQELIAYADAAMYSAKECGGGQLGTIEKGTRSLEVTVLGALNGLVRAVDRKDRYTKDHSDLVADHAVQFGRYLRLPDTEVHALEIAGQLHDVGKIAVPDSVLRKPGRLSTDEEALIRQHVVFSELIIKGVPNLELVLDAVAHHHERWDGLGYPYGKRGEEIPLLGRILSMADALAAMTHDRPYRKGRSMEQAFTELRKGAGSQFDPDLIEEFIASVSTGTALLREETRRKRLNPFNSDPDDPPEIFGLTDYLRQRRELQDGAEEGQRDTA